MFDLSRLVSTLRRWKSERICIHGRSPCATKAPHLWLNAAGLVCLVGRKYALHMLVRPSHWEWGHRTEDYDLIAEYYGLGPLFLLVEDNTVSPVDPATCPCPGAVVGNWDGSEWWCADCWKPLLKIDSRVQGAL